MNVSHRTNAGFTAVELLITLFIAGMFIVAGYQLFNIVIRDGAEARAESRASNIAYNYMRKHSTAATNPCTAQTPASNVTVAEDTDGLTDVTITITISCPQTDAPTVSKVESLIAYNNPQKTLRFSTFVDTSKGATLNPDVTDGLVGWWKLNGNGNSELSSSANATPTAVSAGTGQNGQPSNAMNFTTTSSRLTGPATSELSPGVVSLSIWINPRGWNPGSASAFIYKRATAAVGDGYSIGYLTASNRVYADCSSPRWITTYTPPLNTWTHLTLVCTPSSVTLYVNGGATTLNRTSNDMTNATLGASAPITIGNDSVATNNYGFDGLLDDARVYNRALSASEALQLFNGGAK